MDFLVYILQSSKNGKLYIGQTQYLADRLYRHNKGYSKSTRSGVPWKLIHSEKFSTRSEAVKRERYLKTLKNKKYILENIISRTD